MLCFYILFLISDTPSIVEVSSNKSFSLSNTTSSSTTLPTITSKAQPSPSWLIHTGQTSETSSSGGNRLANVTKTIHSVSTTAKFNVPPAQTAYKKKEKIRTRTSASLSPSLSLPTASTNTANKIMMPSVSPFGQFSPTSASTNVDNSTVLAYRNDAYINTGRQIWLAVLLMAVLL